ncbi:acyltransferase [Brevibacillus sp. SYSU BS000544]|uniref:acyltransferase n=1 Tax=Brevibacillus sp. SYSU BS000544 TaxID=3416443 RepID=UPI003CE45226
MKKERIEELDVLRGLAFLAVVYQHVIGAFINKPAINYQEAIMLGMAFNLSKFAVPAFVMITGITLYYNYSEKIQYVSFIKKRATEIFIPFVIWTIIYYLYAHRNGPIQFDFLLLKELGSELIIPKIGYHLWFVVMIFQFYLFYPFILSFVTWCRAKVSLRMALLSLTVIYLFFMWLSSDYLLSVGSNLPWVIQKLIDTRTMNAFFYFMYFAIGALIALRLKEWRNFINRSFEWNIFLFVALFILVGYELISGNPSKVMIGYSTSLKISMFFFTVSSLMMIYDLCLRMTTSDSIVYRFFRFVGKYSFGAYLSHALVISLLSQTATAIGIPITGKNSLTGSLALLIPSSLLSVLLTVLISRLPLGMLLIGSVPKLKKKEGKERAAA